MKKVFIDFDSAIRTKGKRTRANLKDICKILMILFTNIHQESNLRIDESTKVLFYSSNSYDLINSFADHPVFKIKNVSVLCECDYSFGTFITKNSNGNEGLIIIAPSSDFIVSAAKTLYQYKNVSYICKTHNFLLGQSYLFHKVISSCEPDITNYYESFRLELYPPKKPNKKKKSKKAKSKKTKPKKEVTRTDNRDCVVLYRI